MRSSPESDEFVVTATGPLRGRVVVQGAKNSVLKLMPAALLAEGPTTLANVPAIADVPVMADLLRSLGVGVDLDVVAGTCTIDAASVPSSHPAPERAGAIRASTALLGALLGRTGHARLALPGGDRIGRRGIDLHLAALQALGAVVVEHDGEVEVTADRLHGAHLALQYPSVGATENIVMAAVRARGVTVLDNAAREPEVADLCRMLVQMGAQIEGIGGQVLRIDGVETLRGVRWATCPDRIEAGTFMVAAAVTGGDVVVDHVRPREMRMPLRKLADFGVDVQIDRGSVRVRAGALRAHNVSTLPYPGVPTDLMPQLVVLATQAPGISRITENVFEDRFDFVRELRRMDADISIVGHHAVVSGPTRLRGTVMPGLDVRAGAAGVLAGLAADGETIVRDVHHVDRGYAGFVDRLRSLGADVARRPAAVAV